MIAKIIQRFSKWIIPSLTYLSFKLIHSAIPTSSPQRFGDSPTGIGESFSNRFSVFKFVVLLINHKLLQK